MPNQPPNRARAIVREKKVWHSLPPEGTERDAGFKGWRSRGFLPHFDRDGLCQSVTFRLADSMPAERRHEWEPLLGIADERERITKIETYLDLGCGACVLRDPRVAELVQDALLHFDGERYRMLAWAVMPNHVHALFEVCDVPLEQILHSWKSFTAHQVNALLGRTGELWQGEYFDRFMRNLEHFQKTVRYIENNPVKAGLARTPDEWPWSSACHLDASLDRSAGIEPARRLAEILAEAEETSRGGAQASRLRQRTKPPQARPLA